MNKKGQFSSFVFGLVGLFVLILVLVSLISVNEAGVSQENMTGVLDNTTNNIYKNTPIQESNSVIVNVIYSFLHFIVYSSIEVTKAAVSYGVENPEVVNPHTLLWIVIISLCIPIVWYLFLMLVSIFLIIKEWYLNKKEKKLRCQT